MDDLFAKPKPPVPKALSVTQLMRRMRNVLEVEVGEVWVEGEVSNLKKQASGHWYFSLKDDGAQVQCAMFGARKRPGWDALEDGAKVRVFAEATVYETRGQLQLVVQRAERAGLGDLQARFEELKRRLLAEGLFDAARKRPVPSFPKVVGIVTSDTGAAIRDVLTVLGRRAPWVKPVLYPVRVQGKGAEREIARAVQQLGEPEANGLPRCDVLIVGRGGGSLEDLWCFNEELLARAIAACPIPVISAVGHEIDFTIADFVADLRAATPSAAAELAVPDGAELAARLEQTRRRMQRTTRERVSRWTTELDSFRRGPLGRGGERLLREPATRVDANRARLGQATSNRVAVLAARIESLRGRHQAHRPDLELARRAERLAAIGNALRRTLDHALQSRAERLTRAAGLLRTLGPGLAFQRGFSITLDGSGRLVRSCREVKPGDLLRTKFEDGETRSRVEP